MAQAQPKPAYKPTKRGGGGPLKTLWWQAPTLLNPHFAAGTKDHDGSRIFYEPLARSDRDGNLLPVLAAEIPSRQNGGIADDGKSVTWKLKKDVQLARRQALHRRRLRLQLGVRRRPGHRRGDHRRLQGHHGRQDRQPHRQGQVQEADAVLGRAFGAAAG